LFSFSGAHEAINNSNVIKDNLKIVFIFPHVFDIIYL